MEIDLLASRFRGQSSRHSVIGFSTGMLQTLVTSVVCVSQLVSSLAQILAAGAGGKKAGKAVCNESSRVASHVRGDDISAFIAILLIQQWCRKPRNVMACRFISRRLASGQEVLCRNLLAHWRRK